MQIDPELLLRTLIGGGGAYVRVLNRHIRVGASVHSGESFLIQKSDIFEGINIYIIEIRKVHNDWSCKLNFYYLTQIRGSRECFVPDRFVEVCMIKIS